MRDAPYPCAMVSTFVKFRKPKYLKHLAVYDTQCVGFSGRVSRHSGEVGIRNRLERIEGFDGGKYTFMCK